MHCMNKAALTAIVTIAVAIIGIFAGGEASNWTFTVDQSTNISDDDTTISGDTTNIFGDIIPDDIVDEAALAVICTQDKIPETHREACENR